MSMSHAMMTEIAHSVAREFGAGSIEPLTAMGKCGGSSYECDANKFECNDGFECGGISFSCPNKFKG